MYNQISKTLVVLLFIFPLFIFSSCLTYYQKNLAFETKFESGEMEEAEKLLAKTSDKKFRKTLVLQKLNQGVVAFMQGKYKESNDFFEKAYEIGEDYQRNYANEAASFLLNPNLVVYKPESHELMLMHYYKALNYLKLGQPEEALVEAKRMNIKVQQLNDKYSSDKKLKEDAFAHTLMGIIYQANKDYNNAFIAYRNAYNVYKNEYAQFFGIYAPEQLKKDLLYTAARTGLSDEVSFYEKETGLKYTPGTHKEHGDVVMFWNTGLGPVKAQNAINFVMVPGVGGTLMFQNEELGLSFPFIVPDDQYQSSGLSSLQILRVVFPKYVDRPEGFQHAALHVNGNAVPLELVQDVSKIAFKSLHDRMLKELGKSLLRFALKKAAEMQIRKQNETIGALAGIVGALTENADTRNWQTLPHSILYSRVSLPAGDYQSTLDMEGNYGKKSVPLALHVNAGGTSFYTYSSLEYLK